MLIHPLITAVQTIGIGTGFVFIMVPIVVVSYFARHF
jgi:hypothetical protein